MELNEQITLSYSAPVIRFDDFNYYKTKCEEIAKVIDSQELTDDNLKQCKELLAKARKLNKALDEKRIDLKKQILAPYDVIAGQIKELTGIIDKADRNLRTKLRIAEEQERQKKYNTLLDIWKLRVSHYTFQNYVDDAFNKWIKPQHLNKTQSINKSEEDMTAFMELHQRNIEFILADIEHKEEVLVEYSKTLDLTASVQSVKSKYKKVKEIKETLKNDSEAPVKEMKTAFVITGEMNIKMVELLLQNNNIEYYKNEL